MDGTLVDTRPRMLATVHAFGCRRARLSEVGWTVEATAVRLGLDEDRFRAFWAEHYWLPTSFRHDVPIQSVLDCALRSERQGASNFILTGRTYHCFDATLAQLKKLGLRPRGVITKPAVDVLTPAFKAEAALELSAQGHVVELFVTDALSEIDAMRGALPEVVCVWVADERLAKLTPVPRGVRVLVRDRPAALRSARMGRP